MNNNRFPVLNLPLFHYYYHGYIATHGFQLQHILDLRTYRNFFFTLGNDQMYFDFSPWCQYIDDNIFTSYEVRNISRETVYSYHNSFTHMPPQVNTPMARVLTPKGRPGCRLLLVSWDGPAEATADVDACFDYLDGVMKKITESCTDAEENDHWVTIVVGSLFYSEERAFEELRKLEDDWDVLHCQPSIGVLPGPSTDYVICRPQNSIVIEKVRRIKNDIVLCTLRDLEPVIAENRRYILQEEDEQEES